MTDYTREIRNGHADGLWLKCFSNGNIEYFGRFSKGDVVGADFAFYEGGAILRIGFANGPIIDFDEKGEVSQKRWIVQGKNVSETEYALAAEHDSSMPPYYSDATQYKRFLSKDFMVFWQKYHEMAPVKIPLEFDESGNPVLAK